MVERQYMTRILSGPEVAQRIGQRFPQAVVEAAPEWVVVQADSLVEVATFLRDDGDLDRGPVVDLGAGRCLRA